MYSPTTVQKRSRFKSDKNSVSPVTSYVSYLASINWNPTMNIYLDFLTNGFLREVKFIRWATFWKFGVWMAQNQYPPLGWDIIKFYSNFWPRRKIEHVDTVTHIVLWFKFNFKHCLYPPQKRSSKNLWLKKS